MSVESATYQLYAALAEAHIHSLAEHSVKQIAAAWRGEVERFRTGEILGQAAKEIIPTLLFRFDDSDDEEQEQAMDSPEKLSRKLHCFLEMIDTAHKYGSDDALAFSMLLFLQSLYEVEDLGQIPGVKEKARERFPVFRKALSSEEAAVKWLAAMTLFEIGDKDDISLAGRSIEDVPGGKVFAAAARSETATDFATDVQAVKDILRLLSCESDPDRATALLWTTWLFEKDSDTSLYELIESGNPADQREASKRIRELAGEGFEIDLAGLRSWINRATRASEAEEGDKR